MTSWALLGHGLCGGKGCFSPPLPGGIQTKRAVISLVKWRGRKKTVVERSSIVNKETELGKDTNKSGEQKH